jgi:hypothetical protein
VSASSRTVRGTAQVVLAGKPLVEPLPSGDAAVQVATGAEPPVDLLSGRQRAAVAGLVPDHVADERGEVVVAACETQQPADLFELGDSVSLVLRYGAPEPPLAAAGRIRSMYPYRPCPRFFSFGQSPPSWRPVCGSRQPHRL